MLPLVPVTGAAQGAVAVSVLTINPTADLVLGKTYAIRIDATAIDDLAGNSYAGIAVNTGWSAYTAGLVCDLGKLALAHACGPFFPAIRAHSAAKGGPWSDAERAVLGFSHSEVGARLLRAWNFPAQLIAAAEFCERPTEAPEDALALLAHLHAAKYVATSFGPGVAEDGFLFELNTPFLLEWGFTPELLQETMSIVHERARARLQEKLSHGTVSL